MRLCLVLLQQHAGEMFVKHWKVQGNKILTDTGALRELKKRGINVVDAADFVFPQEPKPPEPTLFTRLEPKKLKPEDCYLFNDSHVLLGGLNQAKVLTNTAEENPDMLEQYIANKTVSLPDWCDDLVTKYLKNSLIYDPEQKKLPKRKDPTRPAWNFPRDYGITDKRRNKLLCLRLLELCSKLSNKQCLPVIEDGLFTISLERQNLPVTLSLRSDALVVSNKPVQLESSPIGSLSLPDISPYLSTISIEIGPSVPDNHPLMNGSYYNNIHLAVSHYNETEVNNIYETEVTEDQFVGRSLVKAFTFAAAQAKHLYGNDVIDLPLPLFVPCLHTDSLRFHFSIIQLNTLQEDGNPRNLYLSLPIMKLFTNCKYSNGVPLVTDYNPDVFKTLFKFYNL